MSLPLTDPLAPLLFHQPLLGHVLLHTEKHKADQCEADIQIKRLA